MEIGYFKSSWPVLLQNRQSLSVLNPTSLAKLYSAEGNPQWWESLAITAGFLPGNDIMSFTARLTHNLIVSIVMHHIYIALRPYFVSKLWFCHICVGVELKLIYILIHLNTCGLRWIRKYPYKLWEKCTSILVQHKLTSYKLVTLLLGSKEEMLPPPKNCPCSSPSPCLHLGPLSFFLSVAFAGDYQEYPLLRRSTFITEGAKFVIILVLW